MSEVPKRHKRYKDNPLIPVFTAPVDTDGNFVQNSDRVVYDLWSTIVKKQEKRGIPGLIIFSRTETEAKVAIKLRVPQRRTDVSLLKTQIALGVRRWEKQE